MCGRFSLGLPAAKIAERFEVEMDSTSWRPNYNASPGQDLPIIFYEEGKRRLQFSRWGFPASETHAKSAPIINARSETVAEKKMFREAISQRRCLVPADGFYEWQKEEGKKLPFRFCLTNGKPFAMAGLWESCVSPEGEPRSFFIILTTRPNSLVKTIHDRMPVLLLPKNEALWLSPEGGMEKWQSVLKPYPPKSMQKYMVSTRVNSIRNNDPSLLEEVKEEKQMKFF